MSRRTYTNWHGAAYTAAQLVADAVADVQALTDECDQMHRRAVRGRNLVAKLAAWDKWACGGNGGIRVRIVIDGQSIDRASALLDTREQAESLLAEIDRKLSKTPPPVPGDPYTRGGARPGSGVKPADGATDLKRTNISIDPASAEFYRRAEWGNGDLSLGIRLVAAHLKNLA